MTDQTHPPIGILAGNGSLPVEVARALVASGRSVQIVAVDHAASADLDTFPVVRLGIGQIGGMLKAFRAAGCREIVILGGVSRPDLAKLRPDLGLVLNLPQVASLIFSGGDDGVLRVVVRFFEAKGFTVVSPVDIAPALAVGAGTLTSSSPTPSSMADILLGSSVVKALGSYDIGQAVVVRDGEILAVEAAEGTDRMLGRMADLAPNRSAPATPQGVLVKRPKPGQEMRIDLPAIGPATVASASKAGLAGIAVLAGQSLAAERRRLIADAKAAGIFVYGFTEGDEPPRHRNASPWLTAAVTPLGSRAPSKAQSADARKGAAALASIAALIKGGACVVSRGHIIGLETRGQTLDLLGRAKRFQPWGFARLRRRVGVAVLAEETPLDAAIIQTAAAARLAGVAVTNQRALDSSLPAAASAAGLFLVRLTKPALTREHAS